MCWVLVGVEQLSALSQGGIPADGASQLQEHRPATGAEAAMELFRASFFFFPCVFTCFYMFLHFLQRLLKDVKGV